MFVLLADPWLGIDESRCSTIELWMQLHFEGSKANDGLTNWKTVQSTTLPGNSTVTGISFNLSARASISSWSERRQCSRAQAQGAGVTWTEQAASSSKQQQLTGNFLTFTSNNNISTELGWPETTLWISRQQWNTKRHISHRSFALSETAPVSAVSKIVVLKVRNLVSQMQSAIFHVEKCADHLRNKRRIGGTWCQEARWWL